MVTICQMSESYTTNLDASIKISQQFIWNKKCNIWRAVFKFRPRHRPLYTWTVHRKSGMTTMALKVKHDFSETRAHTAMPLPLFHSPIHLNSWHMCTGAIGCVGTVPARGAWGVFLKIVLLYLRNGWANWCQIWQLDEYLKTLLTYTSNLGCRGTCARAHPSLFFINFRADWAQNWCMTSYHRDVTDVLVQVEMLSHTRTFYYALKGWPE